MLPDKLSLSFNSLNILEQNESFIFLSKKGEKKHGHPLSFVTYEGWISQHLDNICLVNSKQTVFSPTFFFPLGFLSNLVSLLVLWVIQCSCLTAFQFHCYWWDKNFIFPLSIWVEQCGFRLRREFPLVTGGSVSYRLVGLYETCLSACWSLSSANQMSNDHIIFLKKDNFI